MTEEPHDIEALIQDLESPDKPAVRRAVDALSPLACRIPGLAIRLTDYLRQPQRKNLWAIAYVLAHVPCPCATTLEVLCAALDHGDPDIRWAIALKLTQLANSDPRVLEMLFELLTEGTPTQKRMATYCIRDLKLADRESLDALVRLLGDPHPLVRVAATTSLKERNDCDDEVKKSLLGIFLNDPDGRVRNATAITLAHLGTPSVSFLNALNEAVRGSDKGLRKAAEAGLKILKHKGPISRGDQ